MDGGGRGWRVGSMKVSPAALEDSELDHLVPAASSGPLWSQLATRRPSNHNHDSDDGGA